MSEIHEYECYYHYGKLVNARPSQAALRAGLAGLQSYNGLVANTEYG